MSGSTVHAVLCDERGRALVMFGIVCVERGDAEGLCATAPYGGLVVVDAGTDRQCVVPAGARCEMRRGRP